MTRFLSSFLSSCSTACALSAEHNREHELFLLALCDQFSTLSLIVMLSRSLSRSLCNRNSCVLDAILFASVRE